MKVRLAKLNVCFGAAVVVLASFLPAGQEDFRKDFEARYEAWKSWRVQHMMLSDYTTNEAFHAIVQLGPPALPLLAEKMERNPEDFHLEVAVRRISKRRFQRDEWPQGKLGDAHTAASMYIQWWKEGRHKTGALFSDLHKKWQALKTEKKEKEAESVFVQIVDLGIPVLPYLVANVEKETTFVPAISKLTNNEVGVTSSPAQCRNWWEKNKPKWELPPPDKSSEKASKKPTAGDTDQPATGTKSSAER